MSDEDYMRLALAKAREGVAAGQAPFGACIVRGGQSLLAAHNRVWADTDVTAHAEMVAIRQACRMLGTIRLDECTIYSTCEPCPMCFTAIHWARVERIVFGAASADAARFGFHEMPIINEDLKTLSGSGLQIVGGVLHDECVELFQSWHARPDRRTY